jgi:microcystin-dependent protein
MKHFLFFSLLLSLSVAFAGPVDLCFTLDSTESVTRLRADGQMVDTSAAPALFHVIGYQFGGCGAQFRLPDWQNRLPIGASAQFPGGAIAGNANHTLSIAELPPHNHPQKVSNGYADENVADAMVPAIAPTSVYTPDTSPTGAMQGSTSVGSGQAFSLLPPVFAVYVMISTQ